MPIGVCGERRNGEGSCAMKTFSLREFVLALAVRMARWACQQPIVIVDSDGDRRICSEDYRN